MYKKYFFIYDWLFQTNFSKLVCILIMQIEICVIIYLKKIYLGQCNFTIFGIMNISFKIIGESLYLYFYEHPL